MTSPVSEKFCFSYVTGPWPLKQDQIGRAVYSMQQRVQRSQRQCSILARFGSLKRVSGVTVARYGKRSMIFSRKAPLPTSPRRSNGPAGIWDLPTLEVTVMSFVPMMWTVWAVFAVALAGLHAYKSRLERDEDDQIFLDDSFDHMKNAQAALVARVHKVEPIERVALWLAVAATLFVVGYYLMDFMNQFK
jgi:hypothetical protein